MESTQLKLRYFGIAFGVVVGLSAASVALSGVAPLHSEGDDLQASAWGAKTELLADTFHINEVSTHGVNWIELYNKGGGPIDLYYWRLETTGSGSRIIDFQNIVTDGSYVIPPGQFIVVTEGSGQSTPNRLFVGGQIHWQGNPGNPGSAWLTDRDGVSGAAVGDFVRWGSSTTPPPTLDAWDGNNPENPGLNSSLGRNQTSFDNNTSGNFRTQPRSPGESNYHPADPIFWDEFEWGSFAAWSSATGPSLAARLNALLLERGIDNNGALRCEFDPSTGMYSFLGVLFHESDGGVYGDRIESFGSLYSKVEMLVSTMPLESLCDADSDGSPNTFDLDSLDPQVR